MREMLHPGGNLDRVHVRTYSPSHSNKKKKKKASFPNNTDNLAKLLSHFSHARLCATTRLPRPWDSPGKNTGVGCHFFLQCMKVKSESEAAQSCTTLSDPMDCSPPGTSVHGIFQARVLEWGAIAFSDHRH